MLIYLKTISWFMLRRIDDILKNQHNEQDEPLKIRVSNTVVQFNIRNINEVAYLADSLQDILDNQKILTTQIKNTGTKTSLNIKIKGDIWQVIKEAFNTLRFAYAMRKESEMLNTPQVHISGLKIDYNKKSEETKYVVRHQFTLYDNQNRIDGEFTQYKIKHIYNNQDEMLGKILNSSPLTQYDVIGNFQKKEKLVFNLEYIDSEGGIKLRKPRYSPLTPEIIPILNQ